jgi:hypothetical protein
MIQRGGLIILFHVQSDLEYFLSSNDFLQNQIKKQSDHS